MKKERIVDVCIFVIIIMWSTLIFCFSSQSGEESGGLSEKVCRFLADTFVSEFEDFSEQNQERIIEEMHFFVRKTAHFCVYAFLGFLVSMGLRRKKSRIKGTLSQGYVTLYAVTDEIHQSFIDGRNGNITDVIIDSMGGFCGIVFAIILWKIILRLKEKRL